MATLIISIHGFYSINLLIYEELECERWLQEAMSIKATAGSVSSLQPEELFCDCPSRRQAREDKCPTRYSESASTLGPMRNVRKPSVAASSSSGIIPIQSSKSQHISARYREQEKAI